MIKSVEVDCPYCGTSFSTSVDCSAGSQIYIEDCRVCCQPIEFTSRITLEHELEQLEVRRENE